MQTSPPPDVGSKPAKGKNPTSAVGRVADHAPAPDGGPKHCLRRSMSGMFIGPNGYVRSKPHASQTWTRRPHQKNQGTVATLRRLESDEVTRPDAGSGTSPVKERRRCMTRGGGDGDSTLSRRVCAARTAGLEADASSQTQSEKPQGRPTSKRDGLERLAAQGNAA
jgi:hypothetical protein